MAVPRLCPLVDLDYLSYTTGYDSPCTFILTDSTCKRSTTRFVNVGIYIDLGTFSPARLNVLGVSETTITKLNTVLGLRRADIISYCKQDNNLKCHVELTSAERVELNQKAHKSMAETLQALYNSQRILTQKKFEDLPRGVRTAIYDQYMFRGQNNLQKKLLWTHFLKGEYQSTADCLLTEGEQWSLKDRIILLKALGPEMSLKGKDNEIAAGDDIPTSTDGTIFGSVGISTGSETHTYTIVNSNTGTLHLSGSPVVDVTGTDAADFSVNVQPATTVVGMGTTTFQVTFNPSSAGIRSATMKHRQR